MKEWEWTRVWEEQQKIVERLHAKRGTWLPNVIEKRHWGAIRWTSGRPLHAASSGKAVPETFAVLRPGLGDPGLHDHVTDVLHEPEPALRVAGIGVRRHQLVGAVPGAVVGAVIFTVVAAVLGLGIAGIVLGLVLGCLAGAVGGGAVMQYKFDHDRGVVLKDGKVRVVTGRYAPTSWSRLVEAATGLEWVVSGKEAADDQAAEAVQTALWEAAGLLLRSSDHTGVEVLADGMERLAQAHRG